MLFDWEQMKLLTSIPLKLLFLSSLCTIQPALSESLVGEYRCTGKNSNGGQYTGKIIISKEGQGYFLTWVIGGSTHHGVAIKRGNVLASSWSPSPNQHGLVIYKIESHGQLKGLWSQYPDAKTINSEDCQLLMLHSPLPLHQRFAARSSWDLLLCSFLDICSKAS